MIKYWEKVQSLPGKIEVQFARKLRSNAHASVEQIYKPRKARDEDFLAWISDIRSSQREVWNSS